LLQAWIVESFQEDLMTYFIKEYDIFIKVFIKKIVNPESSHVKKFLAYLYFFIELKQT
jgi:hypothetical protein